MRKDGKDTYGWVDDVCTWERYQQALKRAEKNKAVGQDGFNAYLRTGG